MAQIPSSGDRQRPLFPVTEASVGLSTEQQRELKAAMTDLLLSSFVSNGGNYGQLRNQERTSDHDFKADR